MAVAAPSRATALAAVGELLGLHPAGPGDPVASRLAVVGPADAPRFLVPTGWSAAAKASCLAYLGLRDARTRVQRGLVGRLVAGPASRLVAGTTLAADLGHGSLVAHLQELLGEDDLAIGVGLGVPDAVWKPTLQVFRPDGTPVAYVKVGWNPVTTELVRTEAEVLARWGSVERPRLVVPRLLAASEWAGHALTAVAPLPLDARRLPPGPVPGAQPVRRLDGPVTTAVLVETDWWAQVAETLAKGLDHPSDGPLQEALSAVEARHAGVEVGTGRWHADWVPWNLARSSAGLIAWDWEYSEPGAPVGLDEVHGAYQDVAVGRGEGPEAGFAAARRARPGDVADGAAALLADVQPLALAARLQRQVRSGGPVEQVAGVLAAAARAARGGDGT